MHVKQSNYESKEFLNIKAPDTEEGLNKYNVFFLYNTAQVQTVTWYDTNKQNSPKYVCVQEGKKTTAKFRRSFSFHTRVKLYQ